MKIACLQLEPTLGAVHENIERANAILDGNKALQLDYLVLPEMAFTGYNFPNFDAIKPFLEPTAAGPSIEWAVATARRLNCYVTVGYPEISITGPITKNFNSTATVSPQGEVLCNYRKSFLYYTDETWASEGPNGSAFEHTAAHKPFFCGPLGRLGNIGHGICMDLNPYRFTAPWTDYEFANTMLRERMKLVVLSMAWLTRLAPHELEIEPSAPDMETMAYWLERFWPFLNKDVREEIIVVFANRCGIESGRIADVQSSDGVSEDDKVCYAGSSCVMRFQGGVVRMYEKMSGGVAILGKAEEGLLVVDTAQPAKYTLQPR